MCINNHSVKRTVRTDTDRPVEIEEYVQACTNSRVRASTEENGHGSKARTGQDRTADRSNNVCQEETVSRRDCSLPLSLIAALITFPKKFNLSFKLI